MKIALVIFLAIALAGCATAHVMNRLNLGMTKQEVIKAMGQPSSTKAMGSKEILEYQLYATDTDYWRSAPTQYWVGLEYGRVKWYGKAGDFGTALPEDRREYIIKER